MTALFITLGVIVGIILLIYLFLRISVRAYIAASNDNLSVSVKYLWLEVYKLNKSFKKSDTNPALSLIDLENPMEDSSDNKPQTSETSVSEKKNKSPKTDNTNEPTDDELMGVSGEEKKKKGVKEILDEYLPYVPVAKKALRKLLKLIRFYDLDITLKIGDTDAYEAALKFGKYNALFYSSLALFCMAFSVRIKHTEIVCDFENSKTSANVSTTIKVRPSAVLALAIYLGINYLKLKHNQKKKDKQLNKEKENSNE